MTLPDNRLRLPATRIDFDADVGVTGQAHDSWPGPGEQARYDYMRMWLIALLSNQSSTEEPTQYREGTIWFDLETRILKIYSDNTWVPISDVIKMTTTIGSENLTSSLSELYDSIGSLIGSNSLEATWSGNCYASSATIIIVPAEIQALIDITKTTPFVYINGILIDPRDAEFYTSATVKLKNDVTLNDGDRYTVVVKNIIPQAFHIPSIDLT